MARRKSEADETPQANVEELLSAVTAPEATPPAEPQASEREDGKTVTVFGNVTRIDH